MLACADDGEEGVREHREGHPPRPESVAADLVFVQAGEALETARPSPPPPCVSLPADGP